MRGWMVAALGSTAMAMAAQAADTFPERKVDEAKSYTIEYSAGDETYAAALARALPIDLHTPAAAQQLPLTVASLRLRRDEVLKIIGAQLGLAAPTPKMGETYDAFVLGYTALQSLRLMDEDWSHMTWPIKIGETPGASPDEEIRQRLDELVQNAQQLSAFQSAEIQGMAVLAVLHETVESTLVATTIRSPDRRWFCEGVANYVAYQVIEALTGPDTARHYYDVDSEVSRYAALRPRADLEHWPVVESPDSKDVPTDVNSASYAFATKAVFTDGERCVVSGARDHLGNFAAATRRGHGVSSSLSPRLSTAA